MDLDVDYHGKDRICIYSAWGGHCHDLSPVHYLQDKGCISNTVTESLATVDSLACCLICWVLSGEVHIMASSRDLPCDCNTDPINLTLILATRTHGTIFSPSPLVWIRTLLDIDFFLFFFQFSTPPCSLMCACLHSPISLSLSVCLMYNYYNHADSPKLIQAIFTCVKTQPVKNYLP